MKERLASPEKVLPPTFKFVYVEHDGIENAELTWDELQDCDIILMEETGFSEAKKKAVEEDMKKATFHPFSISGQRVRQRILSRKEYGWGSYLMAKAVETKKEFHLIDVRGNDPAKEIERDAAAFYKEGFHLFNHASPTSSVIFMEKAIQKYSEAHTARTGAIVIQIQAFHELNKKRLQGKRIGIAEGAAHQPTYEAFKLRFPEMESLKVVATPRSELIFTRLLINAELSGGTNISREDIKRMFLADSIVFSYLRTLRASEPEDVLYATADMVVKDLSQNTVDAYWKLVSSTEGNPDIVNKVYFAIGHSILENRGSEQPTLKDG